MVNLIEVTDELKGMLNKGAYKVRTGLELNQIAEIDTNHWIAFPDEFLDGKYVNWSMSPGRIGYDKHNSMTNKAIEKVSKDLGYNLRNTGTDSMGREFIGDINREQAIKTNLSLGQKTPSVEQGIDIYHLLDEGAKGNIKLYNNAGQPLPSDYLGKVRDDIFKAQKGVAWRGIWFEDFFTEENDKIKINNDYRMNKKGILIPNYSEFLDENTSMEDKQISLPSLVKTHTRGMVSVDTKKGKIHSYFPRKNSGARFVAYVVGNADLDCGRDPSSAYSGLGELALKKREK